MISLDKKIDGIAKYIHNNSSNPSSVEVLKYSLTILLNYLLVFVTVMIICAFTGNVMDGFIALILLPLLRTFSGGVHLKTAKSCNYLSTILLLIAIYTKYNYFYIGIFLNILSILILLFYAPSGIKNISKLDEKYHPLLKIISILIVSVNFFVESSLASNVFFIQSITLLKTSQKIVEKCKL
ncbi:accessory gene regulator B family protein [Paenibacillus hamazuiensis]|uniref:accessory gene regulator B family protein n=1 Tax=Paenibacillus hamazuiensis TaxID=2936508 RepID=UPI00200E8B53|nr:accessory gene regulator B family protein [Paenibacillus hamazuiensis]